MQQVLNRVRSQLAVAVLTFLAFTGCDGGMGQVTGKVTANGQPVVGANVTFEDPVNHVRANGVTDNSGTYSLSTNAQGDGAPVGAYRIAVVQAGAADSSQVTAPPRQFPPKFERSETSGLSYTVKPGRQSHDITLPAATP
jgi:hypothetical protein